MTHARDARAEAQSHLPVGAHARVLEPSPPANLDPDWYADDPTSADGAERPLVTPIPEEGTAWAELAESTPTIAEYAHAHWLDGTRRLEPLPPDYVGTRDALHQIAFFAVAPKRFAANTKLGLRYTSGGFGTPFFRDHTADKHAVDEQVRVERSSLVHQAGVEVRTHKITTLSAATEFLGIDFKPMWFEGFHDPLTPVDPDEVLGVDEAATAALASWFGFSTLVLEKLRRTPSAEDVSRVQLWPEHFDPAVELGSVAKSERASYGASPGDSGHPEPYIYVSPWALEDTSADFWNAEAYTGAILGYKDLLAAADPYETALDFYQTGIRLLHS